jgi:hypothetical protein
LAARSADHAFCPFFNSFFGALARTFFLWRRRFNIGSNFGNLRFSFLRKRKIQNDFYFCGKIGMQPERIFLCSKSRLGQLGFILSGCTKAALCAFWYYQSNL